MSTPQPSRRSTPGRVLAAQLLALVALVAALVGALGPADRVATGYSWPPRELPAASPETAWYTPLLLARHRPRALSARIPCALPPPLSAASRAPIVLASARRPTRADALAVTRSKSRLDVAVGDRLLARVPLSPRRSGIQDCSYRLHLESTRWSLEGGPGRVRLDGALTAPPVVFGLFSELDLRRGDGPHVEVMTEAHATRTVPRQAVAWTIAALAACLSLALLAFERATHAGASLRRAARALRANVHPVDGIVASVLLVWWILSPAFFDDGWIYAKQSMYSAAGGFSSYFIVYGTNAPLGYWLDWLQHWLTQSTSLIVVLRVPALLCLVASWAACRFVLARVLAARATNAAPVWALAAAFLAGALAWGMTLRPEPMTALLVIGVAACIVHFLEQPSAAPLAVAAILVPLALSAHPSGIVALAPVLAALPALVRWVRPRLVTGMTLLVSALALLVALAFVGSDIEHRRLDADAFRGYGSVADWSDERVRYELLSSFPYGTPLRRLFVALSLLAIAAFAVRLVARRWDGRLSFPSMALTIGFVLLVATPSKWPWHFGTLIGLTALAVASETAWIVHERRRARGWRLWPLLGIMAAVAAGAWAWGLRTSWNLVDLRTLDWHPDLVDRLALVEIAILLPLLAAGAAVVVRFLRGQRSARYQEPWRIVSWTAALLTAPIVVFTAGVLAADTANADSWSLARGNVDALLGHSKCGLAEDVVVPVLGSVRALPEAAPIDVRTTTTTRSPVGPLPRFVLNASGRKPKHTPWFRLPPDRSFGLFVAGVPGSAASLVLEWGRGVDLDVRPVATEPISSIIAEIPNAGPWQFYAASELPRPRPDATAVRVAYRSEAPDGEWLAVTAPVRYENELLADRIGAPGVRTLVHPDLVPYFPCARLPRLRNGVAEPAQYIVAAGHPALPRPYPLSPLAGLDDVYDINRLSTADSLEPPERVFVYEVSDPADVAPAGVTIVRS